MLQDGLWALTHAICWLADMQRPDTVRKANWQKGGKISKPNVSKKEVGGGGVSVS